MTSPTARANAARRQQQPVVLIATPIYSGVHPEFVHSLLATQQLLGDRGIQTGWVSLRGYTVARARNMLAAACLANAAMTHVLWVDSDIAWPAEAVLQLLLHDVDFVCGLYAYKGFEGDDRSVSRLTCLPLADGDHTPRHDTHAALLELAWAGAGFMLTRRGVYERLAQAFPKAKIAQSLDLGEICAGAPRWHYDFFPSHLDDGELVGEDVGFCDRWRSIGGQVWADPTIQLTHYGEHGYRADPMRLFRQNSVAA